MAITKPSLKPAVFIDKDGTLLVNTPYNVDVSKIRFVPGSISTLKMVSALGFQIVMISNQSGVAHGYFTMADLEVVEFYVRSYLDTFTIPVAGFYVCPHHPQGKIKAYRFDCDCRKPKPGLLFKAATDLRIDVTRSWMIGDIASDITAGHAAGVKTILFSGYNDPEKERHSQPDYEVYDFASVVEVIKGNTVQKGKGVAYGRIV